MTKRTFIKRSFAFITIIFVILFSIQRILDYKMGQVKYGYVGKINKVLQKSLNEEITIWGAEGCSGKQGNEESPQLVADYPLESQTGYCHSQSQL